MVLSALLAAASLAAAGPAPIVYACPDGAKVSARYPDAATAVIRYKGKLHTLKTAPTGDGARYVGDGLQWWTKGMTMGMISVLKPGADYAEPGPECRARATKHAAS